jgi:hypothetical protein
MIPADCACAQQLLVVYNLYNSRGSTSYGISDRLSQLQIGLLSGIAKLLQNIRMCRTCACWCCLQTNNRCQQAQALLLSKGLRPSVRS